MKNEGETIHKSKKKSLSFSDKDFDRDAYAEVTQKTKLQDIRLIESGFEIKAESYAEIESNYENLTKSFTGSVSSYSYDPDEGYFLGTFLWEAVIKCGRKKGLKAKCEFLIIYTCEPDLDSRYVNLYFKKLSKFVSYPYFRSQFGGFTTSAGLMLPPLPSINDRMD